MMDDQRGMFPAATAAGFGTVIGLLSGMAVGYFTFDWATAHPMGVAAAQLLAVSGLMLVIMLIVWTPHWRYLLGGLLLFPGVMIVI